MKSTESRLLAALSKVDRPGNFFAVGEDPMTLPGLEVAGVGAIGLPLPKSQAAALRAVCEQAGYGKGEQTIVDTAVRRVWKLTSDQFKLTNPQWPGTVAGIVKEVQSELGLEKQELQSHLYDLLLYEKGGFFLPHRDGERLDRMVATLIIVLPSKYTGGELVVSSDGASRVIDFSQDDGEFKIRYAAFYADCKHEVKPLLSGYRL